MFSVFVIIGALFVTFVEPDQVPPSFVKICSRNDPNLTDCWIDSMMQLVPRLKTGIPELNLRPIEPIVIPKLDIDFGTGTAVSFLARLRNLELFGSSDLSINGGNIQYNKEDILINLNLTMPSLYLKSGYTAKGQVLLLKFNSKGNFHGNLSNVFADGFWRCEKVTKNGKERGIFKDSRVFVNIQKMNMYFGNVFENNDELNNHLNRVINDNIDILYDELRPTIETIVDAVVKDSINKVYELFPLDVLYPE